MRSNSRSWAIDAIVGGTVGAVVGAIAAVNIVIYAGPDEGYESSFRDIFDHNAFIGIITVVVLATAPVIGVLIARRLRNRAPRK